jgi:hypothetical protein
LLSDDRITSCYCQGLRQLESGLADDYRAAAEHASKCQFLPEGRRGICSVSVHLEITHEVIGVWDANVVEGRIAIISSVIRHLETGEFSAVILDARRSAYPISPSSIPGIGLKSSI